MEEIPAADFRENFYLPVYVGILIARGICPL